MMEIEDRCIETQFFFGTAKLLAIIQHVCQSSGKRWHPVERNRSGGVI